MTRTKHKEIRKNLKIAKLNIDKILDHDSTDVNQNIKSAIASLINAYLVINKK